ncbi:MTH865 family protein [Haloplanus halophilus]|uniref:MTH865 family protein n=1 Tax=Haloplanus halophilus TaxID=2949993 RepID=UPI00203AEC6E|nr:MTH865 family protein [Haloplanus sp. GDY1]
MSDDVEAELREQFRSAFQGADFPVTDQMDLVPALPNGPGTRFEAGDFSVSAMELAANLDGHQEFPYESVDELVDDVMAALKAEGLL